VYYLNFLKCDLIVELYRVKCLSDVLQFSCFGTVLERFARVFLSNVLFFMFLFNFFI